MDISFNCPRCGQHLTVDDSGAGMQVNCPTCKEQIKIPQASATPPQPPRPSPKKLTPTTSGQLRPCKTCGRQISKNAAKCPSCGAPVKKDTRVAVLVAVIGVVVLIAMLGGGHTSTPDKNPIKTNVVSTATGLLVTNLNEFTWPSVTVYINGDPMTGYRLDYNQAVVPHETIPLRFLEFASGDKRFNPIERKVQKVMVHVPGHDAPMFSFR